MAKSPPWLSRYAAERWLPKYARDKLQRMHANTFSVQPPLAGREMWEGECVRVGAYVYHVTPGYLAQIREAGLLNEKKAETRLMKAANALIESGICATTPKQADALLELFNARKEEESQ